MWFFLPRELYLDGNSLHCEGVIHLLRFCVEKALAEAELREIEAQRKFEEEEQLISQLGENSIRILPDSTCFKAKHLLCEEFQITYSTISNIYCHCNEAHSVAL